VCVGKCSRCDLAHSSACSELPGVGVGRSASLELDVGFIKGTSKVGSRRLCACHGHGMHGLARRPTASPHPRRTNARHTHLTFASHLCPLLHAMQPPQAAAHAEAPCQQPPPALNSPSSSPCHATSHAGVRRPQLLQGHAGTLRQSGAHTAPARWAAAHAHQLHACLGRRSAAGGPPRGTDILPCPASPTVHDQEQPNARRRLASGRAARAAGSCCSPAMAVSARTVKLALLLGLALLGGLAIFGHARLRHSEWQRPATGRGGCPACIHALLVLGWWGRHSVSARQIGSPSALLAHAPCWCWGGGEGTLCQSS